MPPVEATFTVRARTSDGESVFVSGSCAELGNWKPENAHQLVVQKDSSANEGDLWSTKVSLSTDNVQYRYFTGYFLKKSDDSQGIIVTCWETNLCPRDLKESKNTGDESVFGTYDGTTCTSKGWLHGQTEVQVRFHGNPVSMRKQSHKELTYRIKCMAIDMLSEDNEDNNNENGTSATQYPVSVSILDGVNDEPKEQPKYGVLVGNDSFIIFRAQTFHPEHLAFQFNLYSHDERAAPDAVLKFIGSSYHMPVPFDQSLGTRVVPIMSSSSSLIGNLTVEYLVVKPLSDYSCDMSVSFAQYWKHLQPALDVGHRGMGNSHSGKKASIRENTVASLSGAGKSGADYVEFDVQLTADNVPVIYHDFMACSSLKKKGHEDLEYHPLQVVDLTYSQLQGLKLDHLSLKGTKHLGGVDQEEPGDTQAFPTLKQCLDCVEPYIGFNVEIKYPQKMKDGTMEDGVKQFPDRNPYVDIILAELMRHAGDRRVVLSCFDADVCSMMKLKQNKYPVVFLCSGPATGYAPYYDRRTWDVPSAINFAVSEELLGINPNGIDFFHDPNLVTLARKRNLVIFCWGKENNDKANIQRLKDMGVHAVIYDRVYELVEEGKVNIFKGSS